MSRYWRLLASLAALNLVLAAGSAAAQTIVVKNAPAGAEIQLVWNEKPIGQAKAGADGRTSISFEPGQLSERETDARVYVDVCDVTRRVILVERALQPPPPDTGCRRTEVGQFVLLQAETSLLVDLGPAAPTLWVRQGPIPPTWLLDVAELPAGKPRRPAPTGLVLFADGAFTNFSRAVDQACGNIADCDGKGFRPGYSAGAAIWLSQYFALEGSFLKPSDVTAHGEAGTYRFDTSLETQIITAAALVGIPAGPVRFYGRVGATHHRATTLTTQTFDPREVTIGGVKQTIPGGTQELELRTAGWGWLFGGGMEGWLTRSLALYWDVSYGALKGGARDDGDPELDERITTLKAGFRVRLGG